MKLGLSCCTLVLLGVIGCASGSSDVTGTDPASLRLSPAGIASLQLMDLQAIRPDRLASGNLPAWIDPPTSSGGTTTYTCNARAVAANAGAMSGHLDVVADVTTTPGSTIYTEKFFLDVTSTNQRWEYRGWQVVTVTPTGTGSAATFQADPDPANALTLTLWDTVHNTSKAYLFTPSLSQVATGPAGSPTSVTLSGTYKIAPVVATPTFLDITGTISPSVVWTPSTCATYPNQGTLNLTVHIPSDPTSPAGTATVTFGPACSALSIDNSPITLGSAN